MTPGVPREEVDRLFDEALKQLRCPSCGARVTDEAIAWGRDYQRRMIEAQPEFRCGPFRLCCQSCWAELDYDVFRKALSPAED